MPEKRSSILQFKHVWLTPCRLDASHASDCKFMGEFHTMNGLYGMAVKWIIESFEVDFFMPHSFRCDTRISWFRGRFYFIDIETKQNNQEWFLKALYSYVIRRLYSFINNNSCVSQHILIIEIMHFVGRKNVYLLPINAFWLLCLLQVQRINGYHLCIYEFGIHWLWNRKPYTGMAISLLMKYMSLLSPSLLAATTTNPVYDEQHTKKKLY